MLFSLLLCGGSAGAQGLSTFAGVTPVGTASPAQQTVAVQAQAPGTVSTVEVLTLGRTGLDFTPSGIDSCAGANLSVGSPCLVGVAFAPIAPGVRSGAVVLLDSSGHVLGTQYLSGTGAGALAVMIPGAMQTAVGSGEWTGVNDGAPAAQADLYLPSSVVVDGAGDIFIADSAHNRIREVYATGPNKGLIETICNGNGIPGYSGDRGLAVNATISNPRGLAMDGAGNLYIADSGNSVIREINAATGVITTIAGTGTQGFNGDGVATAVELNSPFGVTVDAAGNVYIADTNNQRIREFVPATRTITTVAGKGDVDANGDGLYSGDGGPAVLADLNLPYAVAFDKAGNMYIPDSGNNRVRVVSLAGTISTFAGNGNANFAGDGGPATEAEFYAPSALAFDVAGNLYIADTQNNRIRKVSVANGTINTVGGVGVANSSGDKLSATAAGLFGPYALFIDGGGNVYIADYFDHRIREIENNVGVLVFTTAATPIRVDQTAGPLPQVIEDDGNAPFTLSGITPDENAQVNAGLTTCSTSAPVAVNGTCVVSAIFAPVEVGNPVIGNVSLTGNVDNPPLPITNNPPLDILVEGQALSQTSTDTTLTVAPPNSAIYGTQVILTANVNTGEGTLGGTVTFYDGSTALGSSSLSVSGLNGTAIFNAPLTLAVGPHPLTAVYNGDGVHSTSTSAVVTENIQAETTTTVASSNPAVVYGNPVTFTATITPRPSGGSAPTGTVLFYSDGTTLLGSGTLNGNSATYTTSTLNPGSYSITAAYSGDSYNAASTSLPISQVVKATTSVTVAATPNPAAFGSSIAITATVQGNGGTPTGTVSFTADGAAIGSPAVAGGVATLNLSTLAVGPHSIVATYNGDAKDAGSTSSSPYTVTVNKASSTTGLGATPNPSASGQAVSFTVTVKGGRTVPTGTITLEDGGVPIQTASLAANGTAVFSIATLSIGTHSIAAAYGGDGNYQASTSPAINQKVQPLTQALVSSSANPSIAGKPVTLMVTVTGSSGAPTGTVTLKDGASVLSAVPLTGAGSATYTTSALAAGTHSITAVYSGDANNAGAVSPVFLQMETQANTATVISASANPVPAGKAEVLSAAVTGNGGIPTGSVKFLSNGTLLGSGSLNASGIASYSTTTLPVGTDQITAAYSGDTNDAASTAAAYPLTVTQATSAVNLSSSQNPSVVLQSVSFTAAVTGTGGVPTGRVVFSDGGTALGTVVLNAAGVATYSTAGLSVGKHGITAAYEGDANDVAAASSLTETITQASPSVSLSSSADPVTAATSITFTAAVSHGASASLTGTVAFKDGSNVLATLPLPASGVATYSTSSLAFGSHSITAVYSGDTDDMAASSTTLTETINAIPTRTTLAASASSVSTNQQLSLAASVFSAGSVPVTGTVTFESGSTVLGSSPLSSTGTATLSQTLAAGAYTIVAVYSGDAFNAGSTSVPVNVTVTTANDFNLSLNPSTLTMATKQYSTVTLTIASQDGFADQLGLGCASLPASVSCNFSQDTVTLAANGTATVQLTVDTSSPLTAGGSAKNVMPGGPSPTVVAAWAFPGSLVFGLIWWRSRMRYSSLFSVLLLALIAGAASFGITGCGGLTINGAAPGTYTFQVTASGAKTGMDHAVNMTLTVKQ